MRLIWLASLALLLPGCLDAADNVTPAAVAPGTLAETSTFPVELGAMGFKLGPVANTPVTQTSASLGDIIIPEGTHHVVVKLHVTEGASVNFRVLGIEGCEIERAGPTHLSGMEVSPECAPMPGTYTLTAAHDAGNLEGHLTITAY